MPFNLFCHVLRKLLRIWCKGAGFTPRYSFRQHMTIDSVVSLCVCVCMVLHIKLRRNHHRLDSRATTAAAASFLPWKTSRTAVCTSHQGSSIASWVPNAVFFRHLATKENEYAASIPRLQLQLQRRTKPLQTNVSSPNQTSRKKTEPSNGPH